MQVVAFTPVNKVVNEPPVFLFVPPGHTSNGGCVIDELLEVTVQDVVTEVQIVAAEKETKEHCTA